MTNTFLRGPHRQENPVFSSWTSLEQTLLLLQFSMKLELMI
jgi:hypothetical protein